MKEISYWSDNPLNNSRCSEILQNPLTNLYMSKTRCTRQFRSFSSSHPFCRVSLLGLAETGGSPQLRVSDFAPFPYNILQNCPIVLPVCTLHSRAHISTPPFSRSSGTPEVCTLQETAVRPTLARRHFRYGQLFYLALIYIPEVTKNAATSRSKSQSAIKWEKREKNLGSRTEVLIVDASRVLRSFRLARDGLHAERPPCECNAHRPRCIADPPDACMHPRCVTLVFYRVKHHGGMRRTIYESGVI